MERGAGLRPVFSLPSMNARLSSSSSAGLQLAGRVAAAVFGGYALAAAVAVFLAAVLPTGRAEAAIGGSSPASRSTPPR